MTANAPSSIEDLEDRLSDPPESVVDQFSKLDGDILVLGVAGKMGPSLARMARRASDLAGTKRRIFGAARFTDGSDRALSGEGIEPIRCDLLNSNDVSRLPDARHIVYLVGRKFGSTGDEALTWAMNCIAPMKTCERFRSSRIVLLSTGNVYGLESTTQKGSTEEDSLSPIGQYAMSCVGREQVFRYYNQVNKTPVSIVRLNYACDLRYGVLVDLARSLWEGRPVDLRMGHFNTIWQGDANAMSLLSLGEAAVPSWIVNVTGPERLSVRNVCQRMSDIMNKPVQFTGQEESTALLSDSTLAQTKFGPPRVSTEQLIAWVAQWVMNGGPSLNKPTHFESRDGRF